MACATVQTGTDKPVPNMTVLNFVIIVFFPLYAEVTWMDAGRGQGAFVCLLQYKGTRAHG